MSKEFRITGGVRKQDGKWGAEILLTTPDGKQTRLESGFMFESELVARAAMNNNVDRILAEFKKDGVEVLSRDGVSYQ